MLFPFDYSHRLPHTTICIPFQSDSRSSDACQPWRRQTRLNKGRSGGKRTAEVTRWTQSMGNPPSYGSVLSVSDIELGGLHLLFLESAGGTKKVDIQSWVKGTLSFS